MNSFFRLESLNYPCNVQCQMNLWIVAFRREQKKKKRTQKQSQFQMFTYRNKTVRNASSSYSNPKYVFYFHSMLCNAHSLCLLLLRFTASHSSSSSSSSSLMVERACAIVSHFPNMNAINVPSGNRKRKKSGKSGQANIKRRQERWCCSCSKQRNWKYGTWIRVCVTKSHRFRIRKCMIRSQRIISNIKSKYAGATATATANCLQIVHAEAEDRNRVHSACSTRSYTAVCVYLCV